MMYSIITDPCCFLQKALMLLQNPEKPFSKIETLRQKRDLFRPTAFNITLEFANCKPFLKK